MKAAIVGVAGLRLAPAERLVLEHACPAGVILFRRNIADPVQLRLLITELRECIPEAATISVDQEGGRVARLRPPHWCAHPPAARIGELFGIDPVSGRRAAWLTGTVIGAECAALGFDMVFAPVLDLRLPGASDAIGDRAYSDQPQAVAELGRAMADGLLAAGIQPVAKHVPGHGRARIDSHLGLPVVEGPIESDLAAFLPNADLPWMMTAHILFPEFDPQAPATLSNRVIRDIIRGRIGFSGMLLSDDLAMEALDGTPAERATASLTAGCDIALYCPGDAAGTRAVLDVCPELPPDAVSRMAASRRLAAARRQDLDVAALLAERDGLLAWRHQA